MVLLAVFLLALTYVLVNTACLALAFLLARWWLLRRHRHEEIGLLELLLQELRDRGSE